MVCGAQAVEDAGELEADIAGTDHGQPAGQGVDVLEDLVGGDRQLDARDLGQGRPRADGDQNAGGGDLEPAGLDHEGVAGAARQEAGMGREQAHAGALQHLQVDAVQPRDLGVPGGAQPLEGQRRVADLPAIVACAALNHSAKWAP